MNLRLLFAFVCLACSASTAQDQSSLYPAPIDEIFFKQPTYQEYKIEGSVVLYAKSWGLGGQSANQEFIFKTKSQKMPLIRVIYLPACCFDAPLVRPENIFDDRQFGVPGSRWRLTLHTPHWDWDKEACKSIQMTVSFIDENGNVVLETRFQPVSGTEKEYIPSLGTLPCLVLKEKGWRQLRAVTRAATDH